MSEETPKAPPLLLAGILKRPKRKRRGAPVRPSQMVAGSSDVRVTDEPGSAPAFKPHRKPRAVAAVSVEPTSPLLGRSESEQDDTPLDVHAATLASTPPLAPCRELGCSETSVGGFGPGWDTARPDPGRSDPVATESYRPVRPAFPTRGPKALSEGARTASERAPSPAPPPREFPSEAAGSDLSLPGYRVIRFFGKGGMGEVFLADRLSTTGVNVRCVVKTIKRGLGNREQFEGLFLDEARIIAELRHPNITSVIDVGQADGRLYLAMEWIDGVDAGGLATKAAALGGDIPLPHALYILRETLQGLHYVHTAVDVAGKPLNLVHRDISQGNILISKHGAVKLADFGVAVGSNIQTAGSAENLAGKPHYFAPELWRGSRASAATDVFALGVTFYELLSSAALFSRDKDLRALAFEICEFRVDDLIESDLTIPDGLEDIVRRSLHEKPAERYESALEFLEDVNDYAYEYGIRLLDAHFGEYVARMMSSESNRSSLWKE